MLLMAIMKHINHIARFAEFQSDTIKCLSRLTSWCHWLLGEKLPPEAVKHSNGVLRLLNLPDNDLQVLEMLEIPLAKLVRVELRKQCVDELLQLYDQTLVRGFHFPTLEPHMSLAQPLDDVYADSQRQTIGLTLRGFQGKGATIDDQCKHPDGVTKIAEQVPDAGDVLQRPAKRRRDPVQEPAEHSPRPNRRTQPRAAIASVDLPN